MAGSKLPLNSLHGKVLLIVNTASQCGFTPQYTGLQVLHLQYQERGFSVLGFPCNQFGAQEPGNASEIARFCDTKYNVTFPIFHKIDVNGPQADPLFKFLKRQRGGIFGAIGFNSIKWNFTKFLIDRKGAVVARFAPTTSPEKIAPAIEKLL